MSEKKAKNKNKNTRFPDHHKQKKNREEMRWYFEEECMCWQNSVKFHSYWMFSKHYLIVNTVAKVLKKNNEYNFKLWKYMCVIAQWK